MYMLARKSVLQECLWHVPLLKSTRGVHQEIALKYHNKLMIEGENLLDPFQVKMAG